MNAGWLAIGLLFAAGTAIGADLGRMFFTPAQRAALDNARRQSLRGEVVIEHQKAEPPPQNVSVGGLVRRSDGRSTVWLNNRPINEQVTGGINARANKNDNGVRLSVPGSDRSVELKVGQSVEILSGTIEESYARRTVPQKPAPAAAASPSQTAPSSQTTPSITEKAAPPPASPPAKPDASSPIRANRARAREMQDDARTDGASERK